MLDTLRNSYISRLAYTAVLGHLISQVQHSDRAVCHARPRAKSPPRYSTESHYFAHHYVETRQPYEHSLKGLRCQPDSGPGLGALLLRRGCPDNKKRDRGVLGGDLGEAVANPVWQGISLSGQGQAYFAPCGISGFWAAGAACPAARAKPTRRARQRFKVSSPFYFVAVLCRRPSWERAWACFDAGTAVGGWQAACGLEA